MSEGVGSSSSIHIHAPSIRRGRSVNNTMAAMTNMNGGNNIMSKKLAPIEGMQTCFQQYPSSRIL